MTSVAVNKKIDVESYRKDFPILSVRVYNKELVYLDNAATTQKPRVVIDSLNEFYERFNANIHRAPYYLSEKATQMYELSRSKIQKFINASSSEEIIFTRSATESINLVANAWGRKNLKAGDEIVVTEMEHHSNLIPWQLISQATGAILKPIPITNDGFLDLSKVDELIGKRTRIVAITHCSNVLGTINPVNTIAALAHENGALVLVDAAQSPAHFHIDVEKLSCDFLVFSGHKMYAPAGVGVLWGRKELLEQMDPFLGGGDMIKEVWIDKFTPNDLPWKFEAGTMPVAEVIGLGAAIDYLEKIGLDNIKEHEQELTYYAIDRLQSLGDIQLYGPKDPAKKGPVIAFNYSRVHPHDLATIIDRDGIAIRVGHHCAQPLMRRLGTIATARVSFALYNTKKEIDLLIESMKKAKEFFTSARRRI